MPPVVGVNNPVNVNQNQPVNQNEPVQQPAVEPAAPGPQESPRNQGLANLVARVLRGEIRPSQMTCFKDRNSKAIFAKAIANLGDALKTVEPGKATSLGFSLGNSSLEVNVDETGNLFVSVNNCPDVEVPADSTLADLQGMISIDRRENPTDYLTAEDSKNSMKQEILSAFSNIIKGTQVPSQIMIADPITREPLSGTMTGVTRAAVNFAAAIASSQPGTPLKMGFQITEGCFVEVTRDAAGSLTIAMDDEEPSPIEGGEQDADMNLALSDRLSEDIIAHANLYDNVDIHLTKGTGSLNCLLALIRSGAEAGRSQLGREVYEKAIELKLGIPAKDLGMIGTKQLRTIAEKALDGGYKDATALKREIAEYIKSNPFERLDTINSREAADAIQKINRMLIENPGEVQQKADISNISSVNHDPQQGMTPDQKKIHNLVADLFMPSDSTVYEKNAGQGANRIRQTLLKHQDAVQLLLSASTSGAPSPLASLPGNVRAVLAPAMNILTARCRVIQEAGGGSIENTLKQLDTSTLESFDKVLDTITQTLAKDAQKLLTDKLEVSLQGAKKAKQDAAQAGQPWQTDPKAVFDKFVTAPKGSPERPKQIAQAIIELWKAYKEPMLAYMELNGDRVENSDELTPKNNLVTKLFIPLNSLFMELQVSDPGNWFSPAGRAKFDEALKTQLTADYLADYLGAENLEAHMGWYSGQTTVPAGNGQPEHAESTLVRETGEWVKFLTENSNFDFRKSLAEMAAETDDFEKPGMGMFTKNVLSSYFSGDVKLPENATPEQINLAQQVNAGRQIDRRSMIAAMCRYSTNEAAPTAQLGAMLKGAGPLMHKLLQNFDMPGMDPEFKTAIADMKSNLSPIEPAFVQAQLVQLVDDSKGAIRSIKIDKALGAASVGQAFLVTVTPSDPAKTPYSAVLKVIRPDVKVRTERELEHFKLAAEGIPGMKETYLGMYSQYEKEFDLTLEAANVTKGQSVYNDGVSANRVETMSLVDGVAPTANAMLVAQAPGESMDAYLSRIKARIEEVGAHKPKNYTELFAQKKEMRALCQQLHSINKSLTEMSKKWLDHALFAKEGFFHGDLHAGNLMIKPNDPNVPGDVAKVTMIDYGNASSLTKEQTSALFKINVACVYGGVYETNVKPEDKDLVKRKTVDLFVKGLEDLLPPEELAKFKADKTRLVNEVIEPILLRGKASEMGDRMTVLMNNLQREGVAMPGPIINFAQSQMRLNNAMTDLNILITQAEGLLQCSLGSRSGADPIGGYIMEMSGWGMPPNVQSINKSIARLEYDIPANAGKVEQWRTDANRGPELGENIDEFTAIHIDATAKLKQFEEAAKEQQRFDNQIDRAFGYPLDKLWVNRPTEPKVGGPTTDEVHDLHIGTYLKSPEEDQELYGLHQQYLQLKEQIGEDAYKQYLTDIRQLREQTGYTDPDCPMLGGENEDPQITELRNRIKKVTDTEAGKQMVQVRNQAAAILRARSTAAGREVILLYPEGDRVNSPGQPAVGKPGTLVSATIDVVSDKVGSMEDAFQFAGKMGIGLLDMPGLKFGFGDWYNFLRATTQGMSDQASGKVGINAAGNASEDGSEDDD